MRIRLDNTSYVTNNSVGFIIILVLIHQEQWIVHVSVHIWVWITHMYSVWVKIITHVIHKRPAECIIKWSAGTFRHFVVLSRCILHG